MMKPLVLLNGTVFIYFFSAAELVRRTILFSNENYYNMATRLFFYVPPKG